MKSTITLTCRRLAVEHLIILLILCQIVRSSAAATATAGAL